MQRILQSLKDLYNGDNIVKRHLMFVLLLVIPAITAGIMGMLDKTTPKHAMIIIAVAALVFIILSIIPSIFLLGFYINFVQDRLRGFKGVPKVSWETFMMGLRVLPLCIVWGIYYLIFFGALIIGPLVPIIMSVGSSKPSPIAIFVGICIMLFAFFVVYIAVLLVVPFTNYVMCEYVDNGRALGKLFNPLIIFGYMKKAFKETMLVMLKFLLVGIVAGMLTGCFYGLIIALSLLIGFLAAMSVPESQADNAIYYPIPMILLIILSSFATIVQSYVNSMVGYAATDNYIGVYKEKIAEEIFGE